jgi:transcriptional regulator with XRE-family HTH domain
MSFDDFASRMKEKRQSQAESAEDKPYDFDESYRLRGKMVGVLLRDARASAARTVEDCARLLRVAPDQIERWELGEEVPTLPQLELLAYYLDVPISHFWGSETLKSSRAGRENIQPEYINLRNRMVGALLRQAREASGLSLEALSETSGIPVEQISRYELGENAPGIHELSVLANGVNKNLSYFLESGSQIGELLALREAWQHFSELPEDVRAFAANPTNIGFIHIAVMLSQMPADRLREVGKSIVEITY